MEKGNSAIPIIIVAVLFLAFLFIGGYYILKKDNPNVADDIKEKGLIKGLFSEGNEDEDILRVTDEEEQSVSQPGGSSGGGGGGGSSGGGSSGSTGETCTVPLSYAMKDKIKTPTCNQYEGEICVDKTVECSVDFFNRDPTVQGQFKVKLIFLEDKKDIALAFGEQTFTANLGPGAYQTLRGETNIKSTGENGTANQLINCFFKATEVPTKAC